MNYTFVAGIDNGVSGSIGIIDIVTNESYFYLTPVKKERYYTQKERYMNRLDYNKFYNILKNIIKEESCICYLERPMVNNTRFFPTISAVQCLEGQRIALETLGIEYKFLDSKNWQSKLLPGIKGSGNLKNASMMKGLELFPQHAKLIKKHKDADALLIAYYIKLQESNV